MNTDAESCTALQVFPAIDPLRKGSEVSEMPALTAVSDPIVTESVVTDPVTTDTAPVIVKGDINGDGMFNISDAVVLQKWLIAVPDTHLENWKAGDLCDDDELDVFDLCLMKKLLIGETD